MNTLASVIERFEADYLAAYANTALPSHLQALAAMKCCRSSLAPQMLTQCFDCKLQRLIPHSCGHRSCPHCQHHESQRWIERQSQRLVPGTYFMITFTLPAELRALAWQHQNSLYALLIACAWQTLHGFSLNHRQLQGSPGAVAVLHTHSRRLEFHPHVHLAMPAAALDANKRLWRTLRRSSKGPGYLFNHKALAKVFRGKFLAGLQALGLPVPPTPLSWVVDCKSVGTGEKALVYLGRYLYRGVIQERDIVRIDERTVTFRFQDSKTKTSMLRTVTGAEFLRLLLQHVLPKGFRRTRNFGFLHPNSKRLIALLHLLVFKRPPQPPTPTPRPVMRCTCCGGVMLIIKRRILPPHNQPPKPPLARHQESALSH